MGALFGGQTAASTSHVLRAPCCPSAHRRSCQVTAMEDRSAVSGHVPAASHQPTAARKTCAESGAHDCVRLHRVQYCTCTCTTKHAKHAASTPPRLAEATTTSSLLPPPLPPQPPLAIPSP